MRKTILLTIAAIAAVTILFFILNHKTPSNSKEVTITYPFKNAVFPYDIAAPTFTWNDGNEKVKNWEIRISNANSILLKKTEIAKKSWSPSSEEWEMLKEKSTEKDLLVEIKGVNKKILTEAAINIQISRDKVEAPIFFRAVPLPFAFARENLKKIRWHIGDISNETQPHAVLENIPVCANCHSFTPDGSTIAMDVDARDDKGAYAISALKEETLFAEDSLIHWSHYDKGKFTYGLLSQISPNGRYVVSTLKDCEIFADRNDLEYSQLFFPIKGILVVYDRLENKYFELEGANDTLLIQSNPCWSPDGNFIYFTRANAKHYEDSRLHNGSIPKPEDVPLYKAFESKYLSRDSLMKFDIYKIPFNNGKGGKAVPVVGASNNGFSNYFPKISPDGKWMVFCQAESFMLLQKDSKLCITPADGGEVRRLVSNSDNMNSWHSWSPNSKWLVFSTKALGPYTQLFLTHIDDAGMDSPPVHLEKFSFDKFANNIPEFVNTKYNRDLKINPTFLAVNDFIIRIGEIKQKEGDLDGAFEAFSQAVEAFPDQSEPYYKRAYISFIKGDTQNAIDDLNRALKINEQYEYYAYRGLAYLKLAKYENVIRDLIRASELDPEAFTPLAYLGVTYARTGRFVEAIQTLESAVKLHNEDPLSYYYIGLANYSIKNWNNANTAFTNAINLKQKNSPNNPIYALRGESRFYVEDYQGAIQDLKIAITISPNDNELYYLLGKSQLQIGLKKEAISNLLKAKQLGSTKASKLLDSSKAL